jgi:hypothetical protein
LPGFRRGTIDGVNYEGETMPNGVLHLTNTRDSGPSLATRIRTRFRRAELDETLATGVDPGGGAELSLRAEQLSSPAERGRIADALLRALGKEPMTLLPRPQRSVVRDASDGIMALVLRLSDERPVGIPGVAMAARLVDDRSGPLYRHNSGDLEHVIASTYAALDGPQRVASEPADQAA